MPSIPLVPTCSHPCPLDPDISTVSVETNAGVVVAILELHGDYMVTVTYPGPPCQSWAVAGGVADPELAREYASVLLSGAPLH